MSAVSDSIVREYFELHGLLALQPQKYQVQARAKRLEEEVDLLVVSPQPGSQQLSPELIWTGRDLTGLRRAVVSVRGWHTERFSPGVLKLSDEVFRFARDAAVEKFRRQLGEGDVARILCLPNLPMNREMREQSLTIIRSHGVHGVLTFRTMLLELAAGVDINRSYEKSDLLQILRILKNYGLLKDAQMELFNVKRKPVRTVKTKAPPVSE